MKTLFSFYFIVFTLFMAMPPARAALVDADRAELAIKNLLKEKNPGFENGKAGWTVTTDTITTVASGGNFMGIGKANLTWDSGGAGRTLTSPAYTIPNGMAGTNGTLRCKLYAASGTPTHTLGVWDGTTLTNTVTVPAVLTTSQYVYAVPFIFGAATTTVAIRMTSVAADEPLISIDDCGIYGADGVSLYQVSQPGLVATGYIEVNAACDALTNSGTGLDAFATDAGCTGPVVEFNPGPGVLQTTDANGPIFTVNNLPPGYYKVNIRSSWLGSATGGNLASFAVSDGTTVSGATGAGTTGNGFGSGIADAIGFFNYTSSGNRTFQIFASFNSGTITLYNGGVDARIQFSIERWPAASEMAMRFEDAAWRVDANISGANIDLSSSAQSSYISMTNAGLTMAQNTGSAAVQIPCSTTNPPTGLTCSAGTEDNGVSFIIPKAGAYRACVSFSHFADVRTSSGAEVNATFQIVETPTNAQTISQEGKSRITSRIMTPTTAVLQQANPLNLCGTFNFTSSGQKVLRLMYEQTVATTVSANQVYADAGASNGQRDIHWEVYPMDQQVPAPVIVNGLNTNSSGSYKVIGARLNCDSSSSITSQSGTTSNGVASIGNIASAVCTVTLATGTFSAQPYCNFSFSTSGTANTTIRTSANSATSVAIEAHVGSTGADATTFDGDLVCVGPR